MKLPGLFFLVLPCCLLACTGETLDGGANTIGSSSSGASGSSDDAPDAPDDLPKTPLAGTVTGQSFTPTAFELRQETNNWTLEIHNASAPCARGRRLGDDVVIVTVRALGGAGAWTLSTGQASFQRGFYVGADGKKPKVDSSTEGRVRLDAAPGAVGTTVTGALLVKGATSELSGSFTATVCGPL
jgi:hypothetical protein